MVKQQSLTGFELKLTLLGQCRVLMVRLWVISISDATGFDMMQKTWFLATRA